MLPISSETLKESEVLFVFAVIETGGKQYKVQEGDVLFVEKLEVNEAEEIVLDKVLAYSDHEGISVGTPLLEGVTVKASVIKHGKSKKITILRYKPKKNEKKKQGHRQPYTKLQITSITRA